MVDFEGLELDEQTQKFASGLQTALEAKPKLTAKEKKVLALVQNGGSTKKRAKRIAKMRKHAAAEFGDDAGAIDWETFDWKKMLDKVVEFFMNIWKLLSLFI